MTHLTGVCQHCGKKKEEHYKFIVSPIRETMKAKKEIGEAEEKQETADKEKRYLFPKASEESKKAGWTHDTAERTHSW